MHGLWRHNVFNVNSTFAREWFNLDPLAFVGVLHNMVGSQYDTLCVVYQIPSSKEERGLILR